MTIIRALAAVVICLSLAPSLVLAQSPGGDPIQAYKEAGASADQQQKIRQLGDGFEKKARAQADQIRQLMGKMGQLSLDPMPDEKAMQSIQDQISKLQMSMASNRIHLLIDIRHILTPDQRKKLVDLLKAHNAGQR